MKGKGKEAPALTIEDSSDDDMTSSGTAGPRHVGNPKSAAGGEGSSSKRRVTAIQDSEDEEDESKRIKKRTEDDHPDPEVKRLQALVTACGVRKSWKKEFAKRELCNSEEQADYLRTVLRELGLAEEDESLEAAKALGRKRLLEKEAAELQPSKRIDDGTNGSGTGRPARKSKTAANKRTKHELERLEGWQNRQAEAPSSDDYDDDSGDEKRELKKVDKRAARNTDFFLAALGLAPDPARKPKKKRRDG